MRRDDRWRNAVEMVTAVVAAVLLGTGAPGWAVDADNDGVDDAVDACPGTVIPEGVPTKALLPGHYALTDANTTFNTFKGQESSFTTADTAGCSCAQIIALSGLGPLAGKFGCSLQVMQTFIAGLQAAPASIFPGDGAGHGVALSYIDNGDGTITESAPCSPGPSSSSLGDAPVIEFYGPQRAAAVPALGLRVVVRPRASYACTAGCPVWLTGVYTSRAVRQGWGVVQVQQIPTPLRHGCALRLPCTVLIPMQTKHLAGKPLHVSEQSRYDLCLTLAYALKRQSL